jgi:predicted amidophosphoribosyltransferase
MMPEVLYMVRKTTQQARLRAALREHNVRGAFAVADDGRVLEGARVILVDDVTTTGATLRETARVLRDAGVKKIVGAVAATAL